METTYEPHAVESINGGTQRKFKFDNGYGTSVVQHEFSYGGAEGFWELAVLGPDGHLCYDTPITSDVLGWLTEEDVQTTLAAIDALPAAAS